MFVKVADSSGRARSGHAAAGSKGLQMNRKELVDDVAGRTGLLAADVNMVFDGLQAAVADALASGERVQVPGLLTVDGVRRSERTGRNPRTGEAMTIPAKWSVKVVAGSAWRSAAERRPA
jgi:DNA-binding protein HU-beta